MQGFQALRVYNNDGTISNKIETLGLDDLGQGDLVIKSHYSSINYKDALGATGEGRY